ncbi:hypothetical protein [Levilactobacillus suantsaiihabitans]|uniref:hypothetical protein n=1 Tax=Levilactobacillus suantsaiihabitans TaxID=2487722 RepID=UPI00107EE9D4|nr:hypothetical protein [Levilactobacillus suantsaiihabitans]
MKKKICLALLLGVFVIAGSFSVASNTGLFTNPKVGRIKSSVKPDVYVAYKMANKKVIFYRSLKSFGTKAGELSDAVTEAGEVLGVIEKVTTTKGIFYHLVAYELGGFEGIDGPKTISNF